MLRELLEGENCLVKSAALAKNHEASQKECNCCYQLLVVLIQAGNYGPKVLAIRVPKRAIV